MENNTNKLIDEKDIKEVFYSSALEQLFSKDFTKEDVREFLLRDSEIQYHFTQNAFSTAIIAILVMKNITTTEEFEKTQQATYETIVNKAVDTWYKDLCNLKESYNNKNNEKK